MVWREEEEAEACRRLDQRCAHGTPNYLRVYEAARICLHLWIYGKNSPAAAGEIPLPHSVSGAFKQEVLPVPSGGGHVVTVRAMCLGLSADLRSASSVIIFAVLRVQPNTAGEQKETSHGGFPKKTLRVSIDLQPTPPSDTTLIARLFSEFSSRAAGLPEKAPPRLTQAGVDSPGRASFFDGSLDF